MGINASIHQSRPPEVLPSNNPSSEENNANGWGNMTDCRSQNGWGSPVGSAPSQTSTNGWMYEPASKEEYNGWGDNVEDSNHIKHGSNGQPTSSEVGRRGCICASAEDRYNGWGTSDSKQLSSQINHPHRTDNILSIFNNTIEIPTPSAPPLVQEGFCEGPIHYPSINFSPSDMAIHNREYKIPGTYGSRNEVGSSTSCVICWEAPVEGACIPCGHMAGCMHCLNEIKAKKGVCPVCRANVDLITRLYAV